MTQQTHNQTTIVTVPIGKIVFSDLNVRSEHEDSDIKAMAASIRVNGVINPPVVRKNGGDKWDLVAGRLRVAGAEQAGLLEIDCRDASALSDGELVELSLQENVTRADMTDLELWKAFEKLYRAGKSTEDIAIAFDIDEKKVRQHLAIGGLPKKIIKFAEDGKLDDGALKILTSATADQLARFEKLKRPPKYGYDVKQWVNGNKGRIPTDRAIFDIADYKGEISSDLFAERDCGEYFVDVDQFWELQNAAIEQKVLGYQESGWKVAKITGYFSEWDYNRCKKENGGQVFYLVDEHEGSVKFHVGWKKKGSSKAASSKTVKGDKPAPKPELSAGAQQFLRAHRHVAVQDAIIGQDAVTVALTITLLMCGAGGVRGEREQFGWLRSSVQEASIADSDHKKAIDEALSKMYLELGYKKMPDAWSRNALKIFNMLCEFELDALLYFLSITVAAHFGGEFDKGLSNAIADELELEHVDDWKADNAFWKSVQSKPVLIAICKEVAPDQDWSPAVTDNMTMAALRKSAQSLAPADWRPRWLKFPGTWYTKKPDHDILYDR